MKLRLGKYLVDCYTYRTCELKIDKHVTDYRVQIAWLVIDLTDMSIDAEDFTDLDS